MSTLLERLEYGFDRDSRRTWRRRTLGVGEDNAYGYDGLSQVVNAARGNLNLNATAIGAAPAEDESWDYDPTGNWHGYRVEENGAVTLEQQRVHDKGNRLMQIEGSPETVLVDRAGRMTQVPPDAGGDWSDPLELVWDAWSRLVEVSQGGSAVGSYAYDGLSRRTTRTTGGVTLHSYYSDAWRPLEERQDSQVTAAKQYYWGARHRDDLVRRDRATVSGGSLDETRYVLMDYFSPAAITDGSGNVTERYAFSAFGVRRIMAPDFSPRASSECAWDFAFQGQFLDTESGFYDYGYRYYSPALGRWLSKDPIEEEGGLNLYAFADNGGVNAVDWLGLECGPCKCADDVGNRKFTKMAVFKFATQDKDAKKVSDAANKFLSGLDKPVGDLVTKAGEAVAMAAMTFGSTVGAQMSGKVLYAWQECESDSKGGVKWGSPKTGEIQIRVENGEYGDETDAWSMKMASSKNIQDGVDKAIAEAKSKVCEGQ